MIYDYVIVGGGSAGSVLATRLTEDPDKSVLLLEAGPDYVGIDQLPESVKQGNNPWISAYGPDAHSWNYEAVAREGKTPFIVPRGKVTGGSSAINGQIFFRGVPDDYDEWAEQGNSGWSFQECLPYFRKSETDLDFGGDDFHGSEGPIPVRRYGKDEVIPTAKAFWDACIAMGFPEYLDSNHPDSTGISPRPMNNIDGVRMSTALTYLGLARHRLNLTIRGNILVRKVLFEEKTAVGVEAESDGETFNVYAKEVVLCGGAINTPQTMMLSGIGPSEHLAQLGIDIIHEAQGVGENLRDHPSIFMPFLANLDAPDAFTPAIQVGMRYTTPGSELHNDMTMAPLLMTSEHRPPRFAVGVDDAAFSGFACALQKALTSGTIKLVSSDPKDYPIINYNYLSDPVDIRKMREAVRLANQIAERPEFENILIERLEPSEDILNSDDLLDEWILNNVTTQHHSSGTCKMGPKSDPAAVVDPKGLVHGVHNLRIVDASIMPDVIRANTNSTTIMMAERIADWMRED